MLSIYPSRISAAKAQIDMSTVIRSCPGCKTLILSDTDQCPKCGHVFHERAQKQSSEGAANTQNILKPVTGEEPCPHCGEMVRTGMVRCWSCNGFMRADIAARYLDMTSNPQPIIYSSIAPEDRTDYLPARTDSTADTEGFELQDSVSPKSRAENLPVPDGPDKPESTTRTSVKQATEKSADAGTSQKTTPADVKAEDPKSSSGTRTPAGGEDDLFSIAVEEQKEVKKRRGQRKADFLRKRVLVPCSCGAWIRVSEDQAGKTIRCKKCKQPLAVPGLRKKNGKSEKNEQQEAEPKIKVSWLDDVCFHVLVPSALVLKPGSLKGKHSEVDLALTEAGLQVLTLNQAAKKDKSLFSFGSGKKENRQVRRTAIRDQIASSGSFKNLENVEIRTVEAERIPEIRLVQPVAKVSESMFAGVPVFGEGRIAVFLPVDLEEGKQAFLSFSLSEWRRFSEGLKSVLGVELKSGENGVPDSEKTDTLSCFLNQSRVESLRDVIFYQNDNAFQLELTGYKCKSCGTAVSEEGRKKSKLGGAKGTSISKAKCPKCSNKMQAETLYKISRAPEAASTEN